MNWFSKILLVVVVAFLTASGHVFAQMPYFCTPELEKLPIQANGRVKPLYVHANETIKFITGKKSHSSFSATQAYCLLSLKSIGMDIKLDLHVPIEHVKLKKFLNTTNKSESLDKLLLKIADLSMEGRSIREESSYKKAINKLLHRLSFYQSITAGEDWKLPLIAGEQVTWLPFHQYLTEEKVRSTNKTGNEAFLYLLNDLNQKYVSQQGAKHEIEYIYARFNFPVWSLIVTLLALAALVLFKKFHIGLALTFISLLLQTVYMVFRVYISGRAPVTNMYETVLFSGYGGLWLALIIGHYRKETLFVYVGLAYSCCSLMMINFAGSMLSESIGPLVPVLRDNFWLSTHVTTIILSYGAYALSWMLANTVLIKQSFFTISSEDEKYYSDLIYTSLKYGSILLAAGIILGGVWADYSWGRFWGWDPKETWSLIVLCIYMAIVHGKYTSWIKSSAFIPLVAGAFMSVMMAWFGVNYILASGLHSYGFSEGGAIFLGTFFAIQTTVLIVAKLRRSQLNSKINA